MFISSAIFSRRLRRLRMALFGTASIALTLSSAAAMLPVPDHVASGTTLLLQCGMTYQGTLELSDKRDITVKTAGNCGKARISPRRSVTGWTRQADKIYAAPIDFIPMQVSVGAEVMDVAHWPNHGWARGGDSMPHGELSDATLVFLANQSVVQTRALSGNRVTLPEKFYVAGKLWMLDTPGEWAVHKGRLYVWAPDGRSPEGRAWATPDLNGINADRSTNIVIDGISIFSATDGISANSASALSVLNTDIADSYRDGIWASGSRGLHVRSCHITNARRNGIDGWYFITDAIVGDTTVSNTGMVGMPTASDSAILFGDGANNRIENVRIYNAAYHGINVTHNKNSVVRRTVIDAACRRLSDCGGIYTSARDRKPLHLLIEDNTISNTIGPDVIGVYLDDYANGVNVNRNVFINNQRGLVIHNGFDNVVSNNTFMSSTVLHVGMVQSDGNIRNIRIIGNTFRSNNGEQTFNLEGSRRYKAFASYDDNTYVSNNWEVFGHIWNGRTPAVATSYKAWKKLMRQDKRSRAIDAVNDVQRLSLPPLGRN